MRIRVPKLRCRRCGWEWLPRQEDVRLCPRCKSVRWNEPVGARRGKRPGADQRIREVADTLKEEFGSRLKRILLFGSRARGDATRESDLDCLLVFDRLGAEDRRRLDELSSAWLLDRGWVVSWVAVTEEDARRLRYEPFFLNAEREGIAA